ncbi:MAG: AAA family ATPase [Elusimicrobia bacterium]|nr:AAA family ATPase [Elusimicrobiota bacterium]
MAPLARQLEERIRAVVKGKNAVVRQPPACVFAEGHLLIEDRPRRGQDHPALSWPKPLGLSLQRIQFIADFPRGHPGVSVFNSRDNTFEFKPGPIFHHIILADEINRSSPKTQKRLA